LPTDPFFIEHAGELRIFILREKKKAVQIQVEHSSPWTSVRNAEKSAITKDLSDHKTPIRKAYNSSPKKSGSHCCSKQNRSGT